MTDDALDDACELAYDVAREAVESGRPVDIPPGIRSFLYVDELPRRALDAARAAIEDDPSFRRLVASNATEDRVGQVGYHWLTAVGDEDSSGVGSRVEDSPSISQAATGDPTESFYNPEHRYVSPAASSDSTSSRSGTESSSDFASSARGDVANSVVNKEPTALSGQADYQSPEDSDSYRGQRGDSPGGQEFESDVLEDELSSLRGLVDRLTGERASVGGDPESSEPVVGRSVVSLGSDATSSIFDNDAASLKTDLDTANHELFLVRSDHEAARHERDEARRLHSESLKRQVSLERELAMVREERAITDERNSELQASVLSLQERVERAETQSEGSDRERNVTKAQLDAALNERNEFREGLAALRAERDELRDQLAKVEQHTGGMDIAELSDGYQTVSAELETANKDVARLASQAKNLEEQLASVTTRADSDRTEKIELRSRLADADAALESARSQLAALKAQSDAFLSDLATVRTERDDLESQVGDLQASLSSVLADQTDIRKKYDNDRALLNEMRIDREVLRNRVQELERTDSEYSGRIASLTTERDQLITARDELVEERGQLRGETTAYLAERAQMKTKFDEVEARIAPLQLELQSERRQREELANRLLQLDDLAERNQADLTSTEEERDQLVREVEELRAERLMAGEFRTERDEALAKLAETEGEMEGETSRLRLRLNELTDELSRQENQRLTLESRLADTEKQLASASKQAYESARTERSQGYALTELDEARRALADREAEIAQLRNEIERSRTAAPEGGREPVDGSLGVASVAPLVAPETREEIRVAASFEDQPGGATSFEDQAVDAGFEENFADDFDDEDLDTVGDLVADAMRRLGGTNAGGLGAAATNPVETSQPMSADLGNGEFTDDQNRVGGNDHAAANNQAVANNNAATTNPGPDRSRPAERPDLSTQATPNRRQIVVPDELAGDEVGIARFVVNSPDVVLLVDGDAVAEMGWPSLSVSERRDALVTYLSELATSSGAAPDVVFDGRIAAATDLPSSRAVRIRLSTPPGEPTAALDELVDAYPEQWPVALVTEQASLVSSAASRGAVVLNNGQLLDLFIAQ